MKHLYCAATKALATLLCSAVVVTGIYMPATAPRAQAQFGGAVFDVANFITNSAQTAIVQTLNGIAWAVAKTAIKSMTKSMVNWINSGYEGEPAFSQDLNRDLRQVGDQVSSMFLYNLNKNIKAGSVNSPFAAQMAQMTVSAYLLATSEDQLAQRLRYTLLDHTKNSVSKMKGFGGLSAWHSQTFECGNDPTCVQFATQQQLISEIDAEARSFLADYNNGRGFLSWKGECNKYAEAAAQNDAAYTGVCSGINYDAAACAALLNSNENAGMVDERTSLSDADTCVSYDVLTPGSVVEETLGITVNSPLRQLELADSVNEIVGAVVTQMVSSVLGEGGLFGMSKPKSNGGARPIDVATNPSATPISAGFESIVMSEREKTLTYQTAWKDIKTVAETAQSTCAPAGGVVSVTRAAKINNAVDRSTAAIARATTALTALEGILNLLTASNEAELGSAETTTSSQRAWETYQRLLSGNELVSGQEQANATIERSEVAGSGSLYLLMKSYAEDCD